MNQVQANMKSLMRELKRAMDARKYGPQKRIAHQSDFDEYFRTIRTITINGREIKETCWMNMTFVWIDNRRFMGTYLEAIRKVSGE